MNFILCGLPGCGKTTIGKILADKLNGTFIDLDRLIEEEYKKKEGEKLTCRQIYSQKGGPFFRALEQETIVSMSEKPPKNSIIALGGGALENPENTKLLKKIGTIIYLKGETKELFKRITHNGMPAYIDSFESFEKLVEKRTPLYLNAADIQLEVPARFPIFIGEGFLVKFLKALKCAQYVIITDTTVEPLLGQNFERLIKEEGLNVSMVAFPAGEDYKTRETKELCENHLLKLGAGRDTCVIGIGGGVVTDVSGFVASTYCRGVQSVMVPTSLLAMVDASIGGKTGVNVPEGKNLIGTIYPPSAVFILTETLKTLPQSEIKNGLSEMIKHGVIADKEYFDFMKVNAKNLPMEKAIAWSIAIKSSIVEQDLTEKGMRRLLNYGHTVAHAIETATKHAISHGRAVAIGVITESYLSMQMGYLKEIDFKQIREIFDDYQIDLTWKEELSPDALFDLMRMDKKSVGKIPRFVALKGIGESLEFGGQYCTTVDETVLKSTLKWMCTNVMRRH